MDNAQLITDHLRVILEDDVSSDIVDYLAGMKDVEDYDEFMSNIVNPQNKHHITAYEYIKSVLFRDPSKKPPSSNKHRNKNRPSTANAPPPPDGKKGPPTEGAPQKGAKGKKKFQDIGTYKEKKKEKVGRQLCDCEGQEHDFMNNCLTCGRIHCMEEGPGPCFFCGEPVTLMGEESSAGRKQKGSGGSVLRHKENKVFDDDNDYFKANLRSKSHDPRKNRVIALDFATRKVIETSEEDDKIRKRLLDDSLVHLRNVEKMFKSIQQSAQMKNLARTQNDLVELLIQMRHRKPTGKEDLGDDGDAGMSVVEYKSRVVDEETVDEGRCLSMHQPYASLLVAGVKQHEGRTWCTNHRGRLWIAATSKAPDEDEVEQLEQFYRTYYDDHSLKFPKHYPTSCLLGCVFVEDCLGQQTYRQEFPEGESNSPFVLICSRPVILPIFYPIIGKRKIYALEPELHRVAKTSLRYAQYVS